MTLPHDLSAKGPSDLKRSLLGAQLSMGHVPVHQLIKHQLVERVEQCFALHSPFFKLKKCSRAQSYDCIFYNLLCGASIVPNDLIPTR